MKIYIAKDNDRLDKVVYEHYKSLDNFAVVLSFNSHLNAVLSAGDHVLLPQIPEKPKKQKKLW